MQGSRHVHHCCRTPNTFLHTTAHIPPGPIGFLQETAPRPRNRNRNQTHRSQARHGERVSTAHAQIRPLGDCGQLIGVVAEGQGNFLAVLLDDVGGGACESGIVGIYRAVYVCCCHDFIRGGQVDCLDLVCYGKGVSTRRRQFKREYKSPWRCDIRLEGCIYVDMTSVDGGVASDDIYAPSNSLTIPRCSMVIILTGGLEY